MTSNNLKDFIKRIFRPAYYFLKRQDIKLKNIILKSNITDPKRIPIIINNRNRLTSLKKLIESLENRGYYNIYIIDNASSYSPLLDYYKTIPYKVFLESKNWGYLSIWKSGIYKQFYKDFYVYTDSDVVPIEECPDNFMDVFWKALIENKDVQKVGFSLKIDDLPNHYHNKEKVLEWEKKFSEKKFSELFYEAPIDTTFALYRPGAKGKASLLRMFRSAFPYEARHLPWYENSKNLTEEERYYINNIDGTHWSKLN